MRILFLLRLARVITAPHWRAYGLRTLLTVVGVSLGVATVVGISDVSKSVIASFDDMVDTVAGDADLEVRATIGEVSEGVVAQVRQHPAVEEAAGVVERFVPIAGESSESLYVLGVDFLGTPLWNRQFPRERIAIDDDLEFLASPASVAVPTQLLDRFGLDFGSEIQVVAPRGVVSLTVRGVIGDVPAARLFDGALLLMDLPAAQRLFGIEKKLDRVAVRLADGGSLPEAVTDLASRVGPGHTVDAPSARSERVTRLMFSLRTTLAIMSLGAVIVGAFIVYHTVAVSIMQRQREFALLNACGVGRAALETLCTGETLLLAAPGVAIGVGLGKLIAYVASGVVGATVSEIWAPVDVTTIAWSAWGTAVGVGVGLGTAIASARIAIRQTFEAPTVEALRPAGLVSQEPGTVTRPLIVGLVLVAGVWLIALAPRQLGFVQTVAAIIGTQVLGYLGVAMLAAPVIWLVGVQVRRLLDSSTLLSLRLAADNLPRSPGRSAGIVATIAATMAIAMVVVSLVKSFEAAWVGWLDQHFGADLFVGSGDRVRLMPNAPMEKAIASRVAEIDGVDYVERFRMIPIDIDGHPVFLQGVDVDARLAHGGLPMVAGTLEGARDALTDGSGVLLSENLAYRLDRGTGDTVTLPTPEGARTFTIAGIYVDYLGSLDHGAVVVGDAVLRDTWKDERANLLRVWLEPDASTERLRADVLEAIGGVGGHFVLTGRAFVDGVRAVIDRFFAATWALEIVAALVGVIGVINTQLANVLDRAPEIRVMRTIGVSRRDVVRSVVAECGALGAIGGAMGALLGLVFGAQIVMVSLRLVTGWRMPLVVPTAHVMMAVVVAAGISALAGFLPARRAADLAVLQRSVD